MQDLPDWGQPLDAGGGTGFAGHQTGRVLVLPDALALATGPDGAPEFRLTAVRPVLPGPGAAAYGRLDMGLALRSGAALPDGRVQAVSALRGWLMLSAEALDLPVDLRRPLALRCTGLGAAELSLPLTPAGLGFVERVLGDGALPILARAEVEVIGLARRVIGRVTVDLERFRFAVEAGLTPEALRDRLGRDPSGLGVTVESDDPWAVEAAADHLRARLAGGALVPTNEGLVLAPDPGAVRSGQATLDLSASVRVTRVVVLVLDPFAEARRLAGSDLVRRVTVPRLASGQHRVALTANVPRPLAGPLAVGARLVFPARPGLRAHDLREDVDFVDEMPVGRVVRLATGEAVDWQVEATAWLPGASGKRPDLISGPLRVGTGLEVDLGPEDFPLAFARLAASQALLALGRVEVAMVADGRVARGVLSAEAPRLALALPQPGAVTARVVAADGAALELASRPFGDWRIELVDVPGYGTRRTEISMRFAGGVALRALELRTDDGPVTTLAFTPSRPERVHEWFCANPFGPGLRWRWQGEGDFAPVSGERLDLDAARGEAA